MTGILYNHSLGVDVIHDEYMIIIPINNKSIIAYPALTKAETIVWIQQEHDICEQCSLVIPPL